MHSPFRYVPGAVVKYCGPTDTRGSRWIATIRRGQTRADVVRAVVPYADGPDAAAAAVVDRFNDRMGNDGADVWRILGAAQSIDGGDSYAYPVGPAHLASIVPLPLETMPANTCKTIAVQLATDPGRTATAIVTPRWIGRALAVHAPIKDGAPVANPRGQWVITGHRFGLSAGTYLGPLRDAIKLARVWDDAFADALPVDRVTAPSLSQWEHAQQWGRQLRGEESPTGPGAAYVARDRITAADGDGGEQWAPTLTITPAPGKPGRIRFARRLPDGRERLRDPETGRALRMNGDAAAFKGPDPLTPVYRLRWRGQWVDVPTIAELMAWSMDGICETPDGSRVEPDAPDAWLTLLGIV